MKKKGIIKGRHWDHLRNMNVGEGGKTFPK